MPSKKQREAQEREYLARLEEMTSEEIYEALVHFRQDVGSWNACSPSTVEYILDLTFVYLNRM